MKERNKTILVALSIVSGIIMLAQTTLLLTHWPADGNMLMIALLTVGEVATAVLLAYCIVHPELNHNYTLKRKDGGLRMERIEYAPDPEGLRLMSAGIVVLLVALLSAAIAASMVWPDVVTTEKLPVAIVVICVALCVVCCVTEIKLRKQNK
ncbi:MAG: hypothetical protein K5650_01595 [Bacteroidales bacterium]|nr:hypothetical protein [Bacteroidales bacterium]